MFYRIEVCVGGWGWGVWGVAISISIAQDNYNYCRHSRLEAFMSMKTLSV